MRNLTIKRAKKFTGSLYKMKVYLEDPTSDELVINKKRCRKLGDLKNGEEKTFPIGENAATVFVISDRASKDYSSDFYEIPAGTEDVHLSGENKFDLASGNAFRFDGVQSEEVLQQRKKGTKTGLIVLIVALLVGSAVGYAIPRLFDKEDPKTFSSDGLTITLTEDFYQTDMQNMTVCYQNKSAGVFATKESFDLAEGFADLSLEEYGNLLIEGSDAASTASLENKDGLPCFEYVAQTGDGNTYFFTALYKTSDAFWFIQFATPEENREHYEDIFLEWAKSVKFEAGE